MELICNFCGGTYEYKFGKWICSYCRQPKPEELSNEEVTLLYQAGQKLRLQDFEEAEILFADIIQKYPQNPEGYWGLVCAKYGIKYEEDYDGKKIPTCCLDTIPNFVDDANYKKALLYASAEQKKWYQEQAAYVERVSKQWKEDASKEKPYDIFICFKDSDQERGIERTQDSHDATDMYLKLTEKGYRVFMSRVSLQNKTGEKYEPYIFQALQTAKVMIVFGSSVEYVTSTWLQNEWKRYLKRMANGEKEKNSLVVAYKGFYPAQMPSILSKKQCLDFAKNDFYQLLLEYLQNFFQRQPTATPTQEKKRGFYGRLFGQKEEDSSTADERIKSVPLTEGHIHKYTVERIVAPRCNAEGYTLHQCSCGLSYQDTPTAKTTHDFRLQEGQKATCEQDGTENYVCSTCGEKQSKTIPALGHSFSAWKPSADGRTLMRVCQNCNKVETKIQAVPETKTKPLQPIPTQGIQYKRDGKYVYFGSYPQSKVTERRLVYELSKLAGILPKNNPLSRLFKKEETGKWTSYKYFIRKKNATDFMWYQDVEYNGNKYRGVYFTSYRPCFTTYSSRASEQDDNGYTTSTIYWFKYEPIKWRILEESDGYETILAELILDSQDYYSEDRSDSFSHNGGTGYANNYALSNIRKWLNDTFYNTAFTSLQQALIQTVTVDNSARSTNPDNDATQWNSGNNKYACSNTNDKIWLLSTQEATKASYGFNTAPGNYDTVRRKTTSDYARCQGAGTSTSTDYNGKGYWWLRSPYYGYGYYARSVDGVGYAYDGSYVYSAYSGVVPALKICLS